MYMARFGPMRSAIRPPNGAEMAATMKPMVTAAPSSASREPDLVLDLHGETTDHEEGQGHEHESAGDDDHAPWSSWSLGSACR